MKKKKYIPIITTLCSVAAVSAMLMPVVTSIVYESIFALSLKNTELIEFLPSEYGLDVKQSDFYTGNDVRLSGYKYSKGNEAKKGVVVIAHGLGCGGHNMFIPFIDYFASNGYLVFAYDATGNGQSEGQTVEGFPQGVIDLDKALCHVKAQEEYKNLPLFLFGHSWGAYSCGSVLSLHPDISGAVLISGFNKSENLLLHQSEQRIGSIAKTMIPNVTRYETAKFGQEYASLSVLDGLKSTSARIMIVHSRDDETVPLKYGYDLYYNEFKDSDRFEFILYEDRGHSDLFFSRESIKLREQLTAYAREYLSAHGVEASPEAIAKIINASSSKRAAYTPDPALMTSILNMFDSATKN